MLPGLLSYTAGSVRRKKHLSVSTVLLLNNQLKPALLPVSTFPGAQIYDRIHFLYLCHLCVSVVPLSSPPPPLHRLTDPAQSDRLINQQGSKPAPQHNKQQQKNNLDKIPSHLAHSLHGALPPFQTFPLMLTWLQVTYISWIPPPWVTTLFVNVTFWCDAEFICTPAK